MLKAQQSFVIAILSAELGAFTAERKNNSLKSCMMRSLGAAASATVQKRAFISIARNLFQGKFFELPAPFQANVCVNSANFLPVSNIFCAVYCKEYNFSHDSYIVQDELMLTFPNIS